MLPGIKVINTIPALLPSLLKRKKREIKIGNVYAAMIIRLKRKKCIDEYYTDRP
jgi:hypothetical protein